MPPKPRSRNALAATSSTRSRLAAACSRVTFMSVSLLHLIPMPRFDILHDVHHIIAKHDAHHLTGVSMKAVIAAYTRSPFHFAKKGALAQVRPDDLAAQVVRALLARTDIDPASLEDVILGCAYPEAAQGSNLARIVGLLAGLPQHVGGMTVNRFCGSSMQAVHIAAANIEAGIGDAYLCVGVESMTMVPQGGFNFSPNPALPEAYIPMGETAENVAARWNVSRADQDA